MRLRRSVGSSVRGGAQHSLFGAQKGESAALQRFWRAFRPMLKVYSFTAELHSSLRRHMDAWATTRRKRFFVLPWITISYTTCGDMIWATILVFRYNVVESGTLQLDSFTVRLKGKVKWKVFWEGRDFKISFSGLLLLSLVYRICACQERTKSHRCQWPRAVKLTPQSSSN